MARSEYTKMDKFIAAHDKWLIDLANHLENSAGSYNKAIAEFLEGLERADQSDEEWASYVQARIDNRPDTDWYRGAIAAIKHGGQDELTNLLMRAVMRDEIDLGAEWEDKARELLNSEPKLMKYE